MPYDLYAIEQQVYLWSKAHNFQGYNKHDALNSSLLQAILGWNKWTRIIAIQSVMRSPINIRPLLGVKKAINPKGLALFCQGLLRLFQSSNNQLHLDAARSLLETLIKEKSPGSWSGACWGYHYPWQDLGFFAPAKTPNAIVTCFVCEAFLDAYQLTREPAYLKPVSSALDFFLKDLKKLKDTDDELCLSYVPFPISIRIMDVSILIGSVIARYNYCTGSNQHQEASDRLVRYVVKQQTDYGAWYYTDPPSDSHITHDNYHTGFILDALSRYMSSTGSPEYINKYNKALTYYAENLFNDDGSPRWMNDKDYPRDIHGSAQGIITFSRHLSDYPGLAEKIAKWAIDNMYHPDGRFYYQRTRFLTKRFTLMRWCNAWMFYALAALYNASNPLDK